MEAFDWLLIGCTFINAMILSFYIGRYYGRTEVTVVMEEDWRPFDDEA